jgi:hypothetical protein
MNNFNCVNDPPCVCICGAWEANNCTCGADWNSPKVLKRKLEAANQIIKDLQAHMYYNEAKARFNAESG